MRTSYDGSLNTNILILTDDLSDDCNMLRQRGICYARSNSIIRNLSLCSPDVKVKLGFLERNKKLFK